MKITNVTPSRQTVDAALCGPVLFGETVEVSAEDGALLIASGHFAEAETDTDTPKEKK